MKDIRGPDVPIPDSVPDELVAMYGAQARQAVRSRRSWGQRRAARIRGWLAGRDLWYVGANALLWAVVLVGFGGVLALAAMRWPGQMLDAGVLVAVAGLSSLCTAVILARRSSRFR